MPAGLFCAYRTFVGHCIPSKPNCNHSFSSLCSTVAIAMHQEVMMETIPIEHLRRNCQIFLQVSIEQFRRQLETFMLTTIDTLERQYKEGQLREEKQEEPWSEERDRSEGEFCIPVISSTWESGQSAVRIEVRILARVLEGAELKVERS